MFFAAYSRVLHLEYRGFQMKFHVFLLSAACLALVVVVPLSADTVVIRNNFDGIDTNDIGSTFQIGSNGFENNDTSNPGTGLISFDRVTSTPTVGFTNSASVDLSGFDGFRVDWVVNSSTNPTNSLANGWFFGVQSSPGVQGDGSQLWNNVPDAIGITLERTSSGNGGVPNFIDSLSPDGIANGVETKVDIGTAPVSSAMSDGFSVSFTLNTDSTWFASSLGLDDGTTGELSGSGTLTSGFAYSDIAPTLHAATYFQHNNADLSGAQYGSVTVTGLTTVPEPSSLAVLGLIGLVGVVRRRR